MAELAQNKEWLDKIEKVSAAGRPSDVASQAHFLLQCHSVFVLFFCPFNFFFNSATLKFTANIMA